MVRIVFNVLQFPTRTENLPIALKISQIRFKTLPNIQLTLKDCQTILTFWRNFAKSGHTGLR